MANIFASNKLPWSFSPTLCLPMSDVSYDPFGQNTQDLIEETVFGSFGRVTLYCKYGCCGDSKNALCCTEEQLVDPDGLETYKLVSIVAAGIAGLCMITVGVLYIIKSHMKKRRLIRDINSINKMNNLKDITKGKISKYGRNNGGSFNNTKNDNFFRKSKKTPGSFRKSVPAPITVATINEKLPLPSVNTVSNSNGHRPIDSIPINPSAPTPRFNPHLHSLSASVQDTAPPPFPVLAPAIPPPAVYEDVLFSNSSTMSSTGPRLPSLFGAGTLNLQQ